MRSSSSYPTDGGRAVLSFMAEAPGSTPKSLDHALRKCPYVLDTSLHASARGLVSDSLQFPLLAGEERTVLLRASAVTKMFSDLLALYGSGGQVLLYQEGWALGADRAKGQIEVLTRQRLTELEPELLGIWSAMGWGTIEVAEEERNLSKVVLRIRDNFETLGVKSRAPHCWFVRGAMAGYVSEIAGKTLSSKETRCAAAEDNYCEFVLSEERASPRAPIPRRRAAAQAQSLP